MIETPGVQDRTVMVMEIKGIIGIIGTTPTGLERRKEINDPRIEITLKLGSAHEE